MRIVEETRPFRSLPFCASKIGNTKISINTNYWRQRLKWICATYTKTWLFVILNSYCCARSDAKRPWRISWLDGLNSSSKIRTWFSKKLSTVSTKLQILALLGSRIEYIVFIAYSSTRCHWFHRCVPLPIASWKLLSFDIFEMNSRRKLWWIWIMFSSCTMLSYRLTNSWQLLSSTMETWNELYRILWLWF